MPVEFTLTDKITILGNTHCGKSTMGRKLHESGVWPRVVVFDLAEEYTSAGFDFVTRSFSEFCSDIVDAAERDKFRLLYKFDAEAEAEDPEFNEALRILFYMGNVLIVIEEVWNVATKSRMPKWLKKIVLQGRHKGIGLLSTSQRTAETHNTVISQSAHLFCGIHSHRDEKKYLAGFIGNDLAEKLSTLKRGEFIRRSQLKEGGVDIGIVNNGN
jgi:DNA helicase HerA-like ATPase